MFFTFPEDARWNAERQAVEFGVVIGEYRGVVRVPRAEKSRREPFTKLRVVFQAYSNPDLRRATANHTSF